MDLVPIPQRPIVQDDLQREDSTRATQGTGGGEAIDEGWVIVDLFAPESTQRGDELSVDDFDLMRSPDSLQGALTNARLSESDSDLDDFEKIDSNIEDDWVDAGGGTQEPAPLRVKIQAEDKALTDALRLCAIRDLDSNPRSFLALVAEKTNPERNWFSFRNLLSIIGDLFSGKKPELVLNRNCVHCAVALEATLSQFDPEGAARKWTVEGKTSSSRVFQVAERERGEFVSLADQYEARLLNAGDDFLRDLKEAIPEGKRGCISLPVKGYGFSHAMNVVHATGGLYLVCGQQGLVYDLGNAEDLDKVRERYLIDGGDDVNGQNRIVCQTGNAPSNMHLLPKLDLDDWELV
ncbi:MAG: toxin glutamine deamidase domain-containing protein [Bordetella sp.]|uniref:toxin glutamine deamidase domain-containing protein n=1 Tax=Bordetella sp. TaxID=28081 RepID=UPI003F7B5E8A